DPRAATLGADHVAARPAEVGQEGKADVGVLKVANRLKKRAGRGAGGAVLCCHAPDYSPDGSLSQVYYPQGRTSSVAPPRGTSLAPVTDATRSAWTIGVISDTHGLVRPEALAQLR